MADTDKKATQAVKDILDDPRRSFNFEDPETGDVTTYFIGDPTGADIRKADWQYSKVFNQALTDGFPTSAQMVEELTKREVIGEAFNAQVQEARIQLATSLFRLENMPEDEDDSEKEGTAIEVSQCRERLFRLNQRINGPMGNTCENLGDDARNEYLTSRVIEYKDNKKVWPTFEDYLQEPNTALTVKARFEVMLWLQGLDSDFIENTPEQRALKGLAEKRLSDVLSPKQHQEAVDDLPETVEESKTEDVELPDSPEKKPSKKTNKKTESKKSAKTPAKKPVKKRGRPSKKDQPENTKED